MPDQRRIRAERSRQRCLRGHQGVKGPARIDAVILLVRSIEPADVSVHVDRVRSLEVTKDLKRLVDRCCWRRVLFPRPEDVVIALERNLTVILSENRLRRRFQSGNLAAVPIISHDGWISLVWLLPP